MNLIVSTQKKELVANKFFTYHQNNSGGSFAGARYIIVEAIDADEANDRASEVDVYFDGCSKGMDCSCCGDRWYTVDDSDGTAAPSIYSTLLSDYDPSKSSLLKEGDVFCLLYFKNGDKQEYYVQK